jgi:hypothetical protein
MSGKLADEFRSEPARRGGQRPILDRLMGEMLDADAADLRDALMDRTVPARAIADVLGRRGHTIAVATIHKYRRDHGVG